MAHHAPHALFFPPWSIGIWIIWQWEFLILLNLAVLSRLSEKDGVTQGFSRMCLDLRIPREIRQIRGWETRDLGPWQWEGCGGKESLRKPQVFVHCTIPWTRSGDDWCSGAFCRGPARSYGGSCATSLGTWLTAFDEAEGIGTWSTDLYTAIRYNPI